MFNISQYLKKFTRITPPDEAVRKLAASVIKDVYSIDIPLSHISLQNRILYIKTSPGIKSKLFIHKQKLLSSISEKVGEEVVSDIR